MSTLMITMRQLEERTLTVRHALFGVLNEFTEDNVRRILIAVETNVHTRIDILPSYEAVMATSMRVEVFSLMCMYSGNQGDFLRMTQEEIRHLISKNGIELEENEEVPGIEGPSVFQDVFAGENLEGTETHDAENEGP